MTTLFNIDLSSRLRVASLYEQTTSIRSTLRAEADLDSFSRNPGHRPAPNAPRTCDGNGSGLRGSDCRSFRHSWRGSRGRFSAPSRRLPCDRDSHRCPAATRRLSLNAPLSFDLFDGQRLAPGRGIAAT